MNDLDALESDFVIVHRAMHIDDLPDEVNREIEFWSLVAHYVIILKVLLHIFTYLLRPRDIGILSGVCRRWGALGDDDLIWNRLFKVL